MIYFQEKSFGLYCMVAGMVIDQERADDYIEMASGCTRRRVV
jgi:hypothetical protein